MVGLEAADPAHGDVVDRHRIEEVQLFAPATHDDHEVRLLEDREVLRHGLAAHVVVVAQLAEGQSAFLTQAVEDLPAADISEGFEDVVIGGHALNMQPKGCMSSWSWFKAVDRGHHFGSRRGKNAEKKMGCAFTGTPRPAYVC